MTPETFGPYGLDQTEAAAAFILSLAQNRNIVCLVGEPGAGKTTLIKAMCCQSGVSENTSSPTFSLVNEYHTDTGERIYHMDAYRIKSVREAVDFGAEEYLMSGHRCFIEWPEVIEAILPEDSLFLSIEPTEAGRIIRVGRSSDFALLSGGN